MFDSDAHLVAQLIDRLNFHFSAQGSISPLKKRSLVILSDSLLLFGNVFPD